jgi:hypothetical protein
MPRRIRRLLFLLVPLLLIAALGWGWWYMAVGRFPLRGDMHHNFGEVAIYGSSASVVHTFHLRNRTGRTVVIERIFQSCGCTEVRESTRTIEPGQAVDIEVTLSLARAGKKSANVGLVLSDFGVQRLWFRAVGRKDMALSASQFSLDLAPGEPTPLLIFAAIQSSDDEPQTPTVESPEGVAVSFLKWEQTRWRDARKKTAAEWRGTFRVELQTDVLPADARLRIGLGKVEPLSIVLLKTPEPRREEAPGEAESED